MQTDVHLSANGVDLGPAQESLIRAEVARLERFFDRLVACRVVVSVPHRRPGGDPVAWTFRLALTVPGDVLPITRQAKLSFREALEDAFDAARRRLQDYARELRGDVKRGAAEPLARVSRLYTYEGYGFITTEDGHEIYFHQNSVPDGGFDHLTIGAKVRYVEVEGEQGPQASTVVPLAHPSTAVSDSEGGGSW